MAQGTPKIPKAVEELFAPFMQAFGDVIKKSVDAAVDSALEDVEARVDAFSDRIKRTRKKTRKTQEPEAPSRVRRR